MHNGRLVLIALDPATAVDTNDRRQRAGGVLGIGDIGVEITVAALAEDDIMENNDSFGRGRVGRSGIWRGGRAR